MVLHSLRDSIIGQTLRVFIRPEWLLYPEEKEGCDEKSPPTQLVNKDGLILVDWDAEKDADNPFNWSVGKKLWIVLVIALYTLVSYLSAPIYTPSTGYFMEEYGVNHAEGSLGLVLYILGYGLGPLLFSPLSEIPRIGRNYPYGISLIIFCILCVPTSLVKTKIGFYFLRFLQGFFGSPSLTTGGASLGDIYSPATFPIAMTSWVAAAYSAPAVGPIIAGFAVPIMGWRFSMWEILMMAGPLLFLVLTLPETSPSTILYRRARALCISSGENIYRTEEEIRQHGIPFSEVVQESLLIPMKITLLDPAMLFVNIYIMLIYGIYYSFFEVFPIVYGEIYDFNLGEQGCVFIANIAGTAIALVIYNSYLWRVYRPRMQNGTFGEVERVLLPALIASLGPPISLFLFGWTSRPSIHWMIPTIGMIIYPATVFILMQCIFTYISMCYPKYKASLFGASDFSRSLFACGAVLFSRPMYKNLGVGQGCSLLAGLTVGCAIGVCLVFVYGKSLRRRSKFTAKW